jgi:hypothetical protein
MDADREACFLLDEAKRIKGWIQTVIQNRWLALLIGMWGFGKTTLLEAVKREADQGRSEFAAQNRQIGRLEAYELCKAAGFRREQLEPEFEQMWEANGSSFILHNKLVAFAQRLARMGALPAGQELPWRTVVPCPPNVILITLASISTERGVIDEMYRGVFGFQAPRRPEAARLELRERLRKEPNHFFIFDDGGAPRAPVLSVVPLPYDAARTPTLLVGTPALLDKLQHKAIRDLRERFGHQERFRGLDEEQLRICLADWPEGLMPWVLELTSGNLRRTCQLADAVRAIQKAMNEPRITEGLIEAARAFVPNLLDIPGPSARAAKRGLAARATADAQAGLPPGGPAARPGGRPVHPGTPTVSTMDGQAPRKAAAG